MGVRYSCDSWVRNLTLELDDRDLEQRLYALANGQYTGFYSDCVLNVEQMIE